MVYRGRTSFCVLTMSNHQLTTLRGAVLPNEPVWTGPARDALAVRWREAVESVAWCMYEEHVALLEDTSPDQDKERGAEEGIREKMLHALIANKTTLRIDNWREDFWNDT